MVNVRDFVVHVFADTVGSRGNNGGSGRDVRGIELYEYHRKAQRTKEDKLGKLPMPQFESMRLYQKQVSEKRNFHNFILVDNLHSNGLSKCSFSSQYLVTILELGL